MVRFHHFNKLVRGNQVWYGLRDYVSGRRGRYLVFGMEDDRFSGMMYDFIQLSLDLARIMLFGFQSLFLMFLRVCLFVDQYILLFAAECYPLYSTQKNRHMINNF